MEVVGYNPSYIGRWDQFVLSNEYASPGHHSGIFDLEREQGGQIVLTCFGMKERI